jgi:hypothetical protein
MEIDRSNYEIWLIDWLDGNLDDSQVARVVLFLDENPDIREEFYELSKARIQSPDELFVRKSGLLKTPEQMPEQQFEHLCIASLENDLSPFQKEELTAIINSDARKKSIFELYQKTRLIPHEIIYPGKAKLLRRSIYPVIYRFSVIGLSAAAIIALVITPLVRSPRSAKIKTNETAGIQAPQGTMPLNRDKSYPESIHDLEKILPSKKLAGNFQTITNSKVQPYTGNLDYLSLVNAPLTASTDTSEVSVTKVQVAYETTLTRQDLPAKLMALNPAVAMSAEDENPSNISRFLARTVRGKFLKEKTVNETPLKAYELAEAGVVGLNKLFGWEMALDEKKDENGKLKSLYFSSRVLKFNAPVKNYESLP